jgi:hypothetical protein
MKKYRIQQLGHIWHEITVEAKTLEEAHKKGSEAIMNGEGFEIEELFEWQDETLSMEMEDN